MKKGTTSSLTLPTFLSLFFFSTSVSSSLSIFLFFLCLFYRHSHLLIVRETHFSHPSYMAQQPWPHVCQSTIDQPSNQMPFVSRCPLQDARQQCRAEQGRDLSWCAGSGESKCRARLGWLHGISGCSTGREGNSAVCLACLGCSSSLPMIWMWF